MLTTLSLYALTGPAGAATAPHATTSPTVTAVGSCVPGEPGLGTVTLTYANYPDGLLRVTNTVELPETVQSETLTKTFEVSPADPTPTSTLSDLPPGFYDVSYVETYPGELPPIPGVFDSPAVSFAVPDCLANGTPAQITAAVDGAFDP